jgi:hypothetical protein
MLGREGLEPFGLFDGGHIMVLDCMTHDISKSSMSFKRKFEGHPLKGTCQEKKHPHRKKSFFLSVKGDTRYQQSLRCHSFL